MFPFNALCDMVSRSKLQHFILYGGGKRDRTADPLLARQVLSQLSYTPIKLGKPNLENKCPDNGALNFIKNE